MKSITIQEWDGTREVVQVPVDVGGVLWRNYSELVPSNRPGWHPHEVHLVSKRYALQSDGIYHRENE